MLKITKNAENTALTLAFDGRLDTITASQFETEIRDFLFGVSLLILDFEKLEYISSAGLRVLLAAQKKMVACITANYGEELTLDDIQVTPQEKSREEIIAEAEAAAFAMEE